MRTILRLLSLVGIVALGACTYGIKLDSGGEHVRAAWNGDVSGCRDIGKVTVSVLSRVGPIDRNDIKVRDELEVMARNQAAEMHADTIVPLGDPRDGEQPWEGYACGNAAPDDSRSGGAPVEDIPGNARPSNAPPEGVSAASASQPQPFSAPAPASTSAAETFPMSGSSH